MITAIKKLGFCLLTYVTKLVIAIQDYDQASHTTYDVCVIYFIHERRYLRFKVDRLQKYFYGIFIYSEVVPEDSS